MATSFRQQSRIRKFVYLGIIFALFTVSLLHRRMIIEVEANYLELREVARGEADLSSSAVRLLLTGSSGLATTFLWSYALDLQEKHQFNRLKIVVESITKLQPHFSTPWIFQSWNLSFNVSVEFDSPRDKYFYISEGMNLLARGERANQGRTDLASRDKVQRGNPDMRWFLGFTYQLKMGTSDENTTMRCLLDLSCINPGKREASKFRVTDPLGGKKINAAEFASFIQDHPRLVRRLHDGLNLNNPMDIVQFLEDNAEVPSRFVLDPKKGEYVLKDWKDQFPILPLPFAAEANVSGHSVPNPQDLELTRETTGVYLMSRTWYEYAQLPLPPPRNDLNFDRSEIDEMKHRVPKRGWIVIFRGYPARGQFYIAETLQAEGWFDEEGWNIGPWLADKQITPPGTEAGDRLIVGGDRKYHSGLAWAKAYEFYRDFGERNGLYIAPGERADLEEKAEVFRLARGVPKGALVERRTEDFDGPLAAGFEAHNKLANNQYFRTTINYDDFLYQAEAERTPDGVRARKWVFQAKPLLDRTPDPVRARELYEKALALWRDLCLRYPNYSKVSTVQEDLYSHQIDYVLDVVQKENFRDLTRIVTGFTGFYAPDTPEHLLLMAAANYAQKDKEWGIYAEILFKRSRTVYFSTARGPLEMVQLFEGDADRAEQLRQGLILAQALAQPMPLLVPPQAGVIDPDVALFRAAARDDLRRGWRLLLLEENIDSLRQRRNMAPLNPPPEIPQ